MLEIAPGDPLWTYIAKIGPILSVILLAWLLNTEPSLAAYLGDLGSTFPWELFEVMCL